MLNFGYNLVMALRGESKAVARRVGWCWRSGALAACVGGVGTLPSAAHAETSALWRAEPSAAEQAQVLFKSGVSRYQMSDYNAAIEKFSQAFEFSVEIEDRALRVRVLHALQFNLARAHMKSYGIDKDLSHLRTALDLLGKYLADEDLGTDQEASALATEAREELDAREEEARALAASGQASDDDEQQGSEAQLAPGEDADNPGPSGDDRGAATSAGRGLLLGGYASLGLGVASLGLMAYTGMVRSGETGCEGTEWESETSVRCLMGHGARGTRRVAMTAGERSGSMSEGYSVDGGSMSVMRRENRAGTGSASVTVHGSSTGLTGYTQSMRAGHSACEATHWEAETSVRCQVMHGTQGTRRVLATAGSRSGSVTDVWSVDLTTLSLSRRGKYQAKLSSHWNSMQMGDYETKNKFLKEAVAL